jgi:hypothetical protein
LIRGLDWKGLVLKRQQPPRRRRPPEARRDGEGWLALLVVPLVVVCCGLGPLILVGIGTVGVGLLGGAAIGVLVLVAGVGAVVLRSRRKRTCPPGGLGIPGERR